MAKNEAKIKFTAETGEFNKSIQKANDEMSELRAEMKLNETQMKSTGATVEALEKKHAILQNQLSASESKTEALSQKVKKAVEIFGENSQEASKLRVQLLNAETAEEKLRQAVAQCGKELEEHRAAANSVESATETLTEKISRQEAELKQLKTAYVNAVDQYGEASDEAQELKYKILDLSTALAKNKSDFKAASETADRFDVTLDKAEDSVDEAKTAIEKLSDTIEEQKGELDQLKQAYSNAVLEHGALSKEARTLAKQIKTVSGDLDANQKSMSRLEDAADKLDNSLEQVDETAEKVSEGFTVMKGAMADLAADGIEAVVSGFSEIVKGAFVMTNDIDKATNTFIAKTGESTENAEKFEDAMVNIYNGNYGEGFEDIADSMATVKTSMGDIGSDELEKLTTDALILRDTFDMDVNESIRGVNSMMDQFGITAEEAYSLIAQGAQNGLNQNGDLLDVVNEYAVQFKDAGYSAEDMFNMLANGVEAGTWSVDKLGDAVKEFNIRASDGTVGEAIKENAKAFGLSKKEAEALAKEVGSGSVGAYQKLADTLRGVDDDTQRYQLGVSMFGTMWEDLGEDAVMAMLDTKGEISTTKNALDEINAVKYDDLGSAFEGIKRNLETSVAEPIKENVMPAVNEFVEDVDWQGVGDTIGEVFGVVVEGAIALVGAVKESVQWMQEHKEVVAAVAAGVGILATAITAYNVVQGIKTAMEAANVTTVWGLVAAHIAQAAAAMAAIAPYVLVVAAIAAVIAIIVLCVKYWDEIVAAVKRCWDAVCATLSVWGEWINTNVIQPIVEFFKGLWDGIVGIFQSVIDWVSTNWKSIVLFLVNPFAGVFNYLYTNFEGFRDFIDNIVSNIKQFFVNLWDGIKEVWNGICDAVSFAIQLIGSILSAAFQIITLPFRFIWENCKEYVFAAWEWIKNAISTAINAVKGVISTVMNAIKAVFTTVWNAIKSVFSTVWNAIKNAVSTAVNAVKSVISTVFNWIKSYFVTVFNFYKNLFTTVWNAIKTAVTTVVNAIKTVVTNVWNAIKTATSTAFNAVKSVATSVWNSIKSAISSVVNGVKSTVSNVWNGIKSTTSSVFNSVKSTVTNVWNNIKNAIIKPIETAKDKIKGIVDSIKGFFSNMKISLPKIKLPHFKITGKLSISPPSVPKLTIDWYKDGGIFTKPTIFSTASGLKGVGEAGAEAVLPIDKLEGYISNAIEKAQNVVNFDTLAAAIKDLANRPAIFRVGDRDIAMATASANDSVSGLRSTLKDRGLVLE